MAPPDYTARVKELEQLYLAGVANSDNQAVSIETLLDILVVLYDECQGSTLCRERSISGFVNYGEFLSCWIQACVSSVIEWIQEWKVCPLSQANIISS